MRRTGRGGARRASGTINACEGNRAWGGAEGRRLGQRRSAARGLQADEPQRGPDVAAAMAQRRGDVADLGEAQQADRQIAQRGHELRRGALADLGAVLVEGPVADIMQAVFDRPVAADQLEQTFRRGLSRREAGDPIAHLLAPQRAGERAHAALDPEGLLEVGELRVPDELVTGPDAALLEPAVALVHGEVLRGEMRPAGGRRYLVGGSAGCP